MVLDTHFICNMKCSYNHKTKLTSSRDRDEGAREGQACIITQSEVHTICPRPTKGSSHCQQAHVAQVYVHRVTDCVLGDLAGGVGDDGTDLCGDAEGTNDTERDRERNVTSV